MTSSHSLEVFMKFWMMLLILVCFVSWGQFLCAEQMSPLDLGGTLTSRFLNLFLTTEYDVINVNIYNITIRKRKFSILKI